MLQRYKTEKELRKLKEQREKPVFRVGRYKPEIPSFLPQASQIPVLCKPKEKVRRASIAFELCYLATFCILFSVTHVDLVLLRKHLH